MNNQIDQFISSKLDGGKSPITTKEYRPLIANFFKIVGVNDIREVTTEHLDAYRSVIKHEEDLRYNLMVSAVRSFYQWAFLNGLIKTNESLRIPKRPIQKRPIEEVVWLTLKEQTEIINACKTVEERIVLMFPLKTGCRNGCRLPVRREFTGLEWGDFNFERKTVMIYGKGPGKKGTPRYSRFDDQLKEILMNYEQAGGKMPIHPNPHTNAVMVREVAERIGATKLAKCTHPFHALKHSFCTTWVVTRKAKNISEDLRGLSRQVGTGIDVLEVYIHIAEDYLESSYDETMQIISEMEETGDGNGS